MADLNESDEWPAGVYQLEEDDPVLGGPAGIDNRAPRELASRSHFQRVRNVTPWLATLDYPAGLAYVSHDGTSWKSVAASTNVQPGTDATKWVRWAHTEAELSSLLGETVAEHEAKPDPHAQYATDVALAEHAANLDAHENHVRHDVAQGLTNPQAAKARSNIGAEAIGVAATEVQKGAARYGNDTGAANAAAVAYTPVITALTDGMVLWFKAAASNTGASTLNVNGLGATPLVGGAHADLQGGEIIVNGKCMVVYSATLSSFVLIECTGAALQVAPGSRSQHAAQMSQVAGIVGSVRNLKSSLAVASNSATFTADEVIVETALGGVRYCAPSLNKTINLAANGAGGMDTGAAPNGYVGIYAIYNPTTGISALLATNATSVVVPQVYGGANMPAGYTASALLSVLATTAASGFAIFSQIDRDISMPGVLTASSSTPSSNPVPVAAGAIPRNAVKVNGSITYSCSAASAGGTAVIGSSASVGNQSMNFSIAAGGTITVPFSGINLMTPQTIYYTGVNISGTPTFQVSLGGYSI